MRQLYHKRGRRENSTFGLHEIPRLQLLGIPSREANTIIATAPGCANGSWPHTDSRNFLRSALCHFFRSAKDLKQITERREYMESVSEDFWVAGVSVRTCLAPLGATSCSPGREPWVDGERKRSPVRGDIVSAGAAPLGLGFLGIVGDPGLTPWAARFRP